MPRYLVKEGEGVAGPETVVSAETTTLYSCIGIVMRNTDLHFAGLYHYPADTIESDFTQRTMRQMLNDLSPTQVFLTAPAPNRVISYFGGATATDRDAVRHFFDERLPHALIEWMPDNSFSTYQMIAEEFTVNNAANLLTGLRSRGVKMATKMPNHQGRRINANTMFYGGKAPKPSKHDRTVDDIELQRRGKGTTPPKRSQTRDDMVPKYR